MKLDDTSPGDIEWRIEVTQRTCVAGNYTYKNAPKCACSTIKRALWFTEMELGRFTRAREDAYDGEFLHLVNDGTPFSNVAAHANETFIFTFTRNPYERIYSAYLDKCVRAAITGSILPMLRTRLGVGERPVSFNEFLTFIASQRDRNRDSHWATMYRTTAEDVLPSHFIGAVETLSDDLNKVYARIYPGLTPQIENTNQTRGIVVAPPPTEAELRLLFEIYRSDFEFYGYSDKPELSRAPPLHRPKY